MIARLGDFLRLTLDHAEEQMVPLGQEMEFLRCYLALNRSFAQKKSEEKPKMRNDGG
jgi:LytS/YehU family sensor histidine kinase